MKISKFGITLRTVLQGDLEQIRTWRNSDSVRLNMRYQSIISNSEQSVWFNSLNTSNNIYFIVEYQGKAVGVCNLRDIDWQTSQGEGGIFIGVQKYLGTSIPVRAILLASYFFCDLLYIHRINISIVEGNETAVKFNKMLGAEMIGQSDGMIKMYFDRNMFHSATSKLVEELEQRQASENQLKVVSETRADQDLLKSRIQLCNSEFLRTISIRYDDFVSKDDKPSQTK